jgi:hypothetical protein
MPTPLILRPERRLDAEFVKRRDEAAQIMTQHLAQNPTFTPETDPHAPETATPNVETATFTVEIRTFTVEMRTFTVEMETFTVET